MKTSTTFKGLHHQDGAIDYILFQLALKLNREGAIKISAIPQLSTDETIYTASLNEARVLELLSQKEISHEVQHQADPTGQDASQSGEDLQTDHEDDGNEPGLGDLPSPPSRTNLLRILGYGDKGYDLTKNNDQTGDDHREPSVPGRGFKYSGEDDSPRDVASSKPLTEF